MTRKSWGLGRVVRGHPRGPDHASDPSSSLARSSLAVSGGLEIASWSMFTWPEHGLDRQRSRKVILRCDIDWQQAFG